MSLRGRLAAATLASLIVLASGCGSSAPPDPFARSYATSVGPWLTRPDWQLGYLIGDVDNVSHSAVTVESVSVAGPGVGSVVSVQLSIAPLVAGTNATPGGNYVSDPPVSDFGSGGCHKQALYPVKGYQLKPGGQFRLWVVVTALKPGQWRIPAQVITYTEDGGTYSQSFPIRYWGTVSTGAPVQPVADPDVAACVGPERARYLAYYHG